MTPNQQVHLTADQMRAIIRETVEETLTRIGLQVEDPIEMQRDFQHLREWRVSMEEVRKKSILAAVGVVVSGAMAALWLGIKGSLAGN